MKCTMMKGKWLQWCDMTERWKFLYVTLTRKETFKRHWSRTREWLLENTHHEELHVVTDGAASSVIQHAPQQVQIRQNP